MNINVTKDGALLNISLEGKLDTMTSPQLEAELKKSIENVEDLILDFENLLYISSAGLRVLLNAQNVMDEQGAMVIKNVSEAIMDVFEVTGFADILTIE